MWEPARRHEVRCDRSARCTHRGPMWEDARLRYPRAMATGEPMEGSEDTERAERPALAERPAPDQLVRAVARARIADKLFAKKEEVKLGRYHLLEMIGSGGMGVVWGAFDPELDRRVAIKLVKAELPAARDRILAEGKALA